MNGEKILKIAEALKQAPELEYGIYQIIVTNKVPQKVSVIPMSGKITKYVIDNSKNRIDIEKAQ